MEAMHLSKLMEHLYGKRPDTELDKTKEKMSFEEDERVKEVKEEGIYETVVLKRATKEEVAEKRKKQSGIPSYQPDLDLKNLKPKNKEQKELIDTCKRYKDFALTEEFQDYTKNGIYVCGSFGTGKTYTMTALVNSLIEAGFSAYMETQNIINMKLRKAEFEEDKENKFLKNLLEVEFLVIDDLGKQLPTDYQLANLFTIIDIRLQQKKPILYTSNYDYQNLNNRLISKEGDTGTGGSIIDRINGSSKYIELTGRSLRR